MTDPAQRLLRGIYGKIETQLIAVAARLGISDLLKNGPKSVEELAEATGTHVPSLFRILRALASLDIYTEPEPRRFALTPQSELLKADTPGSLRGYAIMHGSESMYRVWPHLLHGVETGEPVFDSVFGTNIFKHLQSRPDEHAVFNEAMTSASTLDAEAVREAYDFSGFGTLVDVGGGHGFLLAALLKAFPSLRGVLFDLPSVTEGASELFEKEGLADRCRVIGGDFFTGVPENNDAYLLKRIIHDWNDESAVKILKICRNAMAPEARVLVIEIVVPLENMSGIGELMDINMMAVTGGLERTEAQYRDLLSKAGLELSRIVRTATWVSIVEGVPA